MELLIRIGQLLLSLTFLVILHELGHFSAARFFKTRVDKFYLFFNPWFSLFKTKKGKTEYGIGWLPLGGYVKIAGMIDESMDKEQMQQTPKPDEFRSKPTWQRLIIILAGVIVNFILAYFIYVGVSYKWGETYLPNDNLKHGIVVDSMAYDLGLRNGDKILKIDGKKPERFSTMVQNLIIDKPSEITVSRNNKTLKIPIPETFQKEILSSSSKSFKHTPLIQPRILFAPFYIAQVGEESPAQMAGLQKDDRLISIDGITFKYYDEFQNYLKTKTNSVIHLQIQRNNKSENVDLALKDTPLLGVYVNATRQEQLELKQQEFSFLASFEQGWKAFKNTISVQVSSLKLMFSKEGANAVGGIGTMSQIFPTYWSWQNFWRITAMLSVMFAFLNVLPIPGLDGGHAIFILYEMLTGRKPHQRFMEIIQTIGILFLISLMIFVNVNDIFRFLG